MVKFSISDIFFSPVESLSLLTFISKLLAKEKLSDPVLPRPGTPKRPLGKREYVAVRPGAVIAAIISEE